jgi:hypothetical protein
MTNNEFREWLRGFFELSEENIVLGPQQIQVIVNHLNLAESVEKQLDDVNSQLRADIDAFRNQPSREAADFARITQSIRDLIL